MQKFLNKLLYPLRLLGDVMAKVVTTVVLIFLYFFGIGPMSLIGKLFGKDFIGERRRDTGSYWIHYRGKEPTLENFKKPY